MKRLIMATMVTAILASSTVWAADNAPVAAQQQTQQVQQTQKTAAAERISEQGLYAMRDVQVARLALFHGDPEKAKELTNEASALLSDDSTEWAKFAKPGKKTNLNDDQYIVINASVGISESYVATPEKEAAIKIANEKMAKGVNRPGFPGECFICELRLPDHYFRWKHNKLFLLLPEEYGPAFPAIVDCYTSPPTLVWPVPLLSGFSSSYGVLPPLCKDH